MKVSVIVTCYNHERYISMAIEGVLAQRNCDPFEIIVCDDHSTDNTVKIARGLLGSLPNCQINVNDQNLGITRNYQKAFSLCKGEYVFVVEGDDYWISPLKISQQVAFLDSNPTFSMCSHTFYKQSEEEEFLMPPENNETDRFSVFTSPMIVLNPGLISNFSTCCYRRSLLQKVPQAIFDVISYDWMINICIGRLGTLARLNMPMSVYRVHSSGQWSKKNKLEQLKGIYMIIPEYNKLLGYIYNAEFKQKRKLILKQIVLCQQASEKSLMGRLIIQIVYQAKSILGISDKLINH